MITNHFDPIDFINEQNDELLNTLNAEKILADRKVISYKFNSGEIAPYVGRGSETNCKIWGEIWNTFHQVPSPLIYWFEIGTEDEPQKVYDTMRAFSNSPSNSAPDIRRTLPSFRGTSKEPVSRTLYVGCCKTTKFGARLFWHMGYYTVGGTQGLQICHWAIPLNLTMTISVFQCL